MVTFHPKKKNMTFKWIKMLNKIIEETRLVYVPLKGDTKG